MNFNPRIFFLLTAIICFISVVVSLYKGKEIDVNFWISVMWVIMGVLLWLGVDKRKENPQEGE